MTLIGAAFARRALVCCKRCTLNPAPVALNPHPKSLRPGGNMTTYGHTRTRTRTQRQPGAPRWERAARAQAARRSRLCHIVGPRAARDRARHGPPGGPRERSFVFCGYILGPCTVDEFIIALAVRMSTVCVSTVCVSAVCMNTACIQPHQAVVQVVFRNATETRSQDRGVRGYTRTHTHTHTHAHTPHTQDRGVRGARTQSLVSWMWRRRRRRRRRQRRRRQAGLRARNKVQGRRRDRRKRRFHNI